MSLKRPTKLGLLLIAFAMAYALAPSRTKVVHADGDDVTLTGCVVQGSEGGNGFLLTNVLPASIDMSTRAAARRGDADTAGTSGTLPGASNVVYWLDDLEKDDDLPNYAGKRVEVRGELEGDIKKGEMEIGRDGDWVKLEIRSDSGKVATRIPYVSVMPNGTSTPVGTSGTSAAPGHARGAASSSNGGMKDDQEIELNVNVRKLDVKDVRIVAGSCGE